MLRTRLKDALKRAMLDKDQRTLSTVRLILAALKDRDIALRGTSDEDTISDDAILQLLQSMVKQRRESISMYEKGGRQELAQQEQEEIVVIEQFLPQQMPDDEIEAAVNDVITELGAEGLKGMGGVMAALRERHAGCMDFGKASGIAKKNLAG